MLTQCKIAHTIGGMKTPEIQEHLQREDMNVSAFAKRHKLPLRTLMRIKAEGTATSANAKVIGDAIKKDLKKEMKK